MELFHLLPAENCAFVKRNPDPFQLWEDFADEAEVFVVLRERQGQYHTGHAGVAASRLARAFGMRPVVNNRHSVAALRGDNGVRSANGMNYIEPCSSGASCFRLEFGNAI